MRITGIRVYCADLRYAGGAYAFAGNRTYSSFQTVVVALETDAGLTGFGEVCPCGPVYMPSHADGILPALRVLTPSLLGEDPRHVTRVQQRMDGALNGQHGAKTAVDLACWDLLGKDCGQPVYLLLGGLLTESIPLHRVVPLDAPRRMVATVERLRGEGFRHFQVKLGQDVEDDVEAMRSIAASSGAGEVLVGDANGAWTRRRAVLVSDALRDVPCLLEQPCRTYEECRSVRRRVRHPIKLDESLNFLSHFREAIADDAMDAASIKLSKFGGLTVSRVIRDLCVDAGIELTVEDAWGGGIVGAAVAHLAASTPPEVLLNATDIHNYNENRIATGVPDVAHGEMRVSDRPGLGVEPDFDALGEPAWRGA